ncbi:MAG TPA: hypothetical protein VH396_04040 [Chitinophagaceae bacterium]
MLEGNKCSFYAPYFGLDLQNFRKWLEIQFDDDLTWETFSTSWQFDHIIPLTYFSFKNEEDLRLCWNFINIRVEKIQIEKKNINRIDVLAAKRYFETLYHHTGYPLCQKMVDKITQIELSEIKGAEKLISFIEENKSYLETILAFSSYEYDKLNERVPLKEILAEIELLKKFG